MIISEAINRAIDYILGNLEEDLSIERVAAHCHFSNVRNNFKEVCDRVVHDSDIAIITRKNDENVVLMSQAQYDNLMENLHIRESKANYEWLKESIKQAEDGKLISFDVED